MTPPNPKIQLYFDAFLSRNSKEKLKHEFLDCNGRKRSHLCDSFWNKDIAESCDRELQLLAKSSLSIVSKARIEIIGASANDVVNEESRFGSMLVSGNALNELQSLNTPFDRDFQGCNSRNSSLHFASKAFNGKFSPCVLVGEWSTRLEDENCFKISSKVSNIGNKEESDHFTCPVCLLNIPRDGTGVSHLAFELIELKNVSKISHCNITSRRSMNFSSLVTWLGGNDKNDEEINCDIEAEEINIYADTTPEGDERMNSSALRYKEFVQVRKNRRCRLVDWQKTKRRRDTGIQKDTTGHAQHPLPVDLERLRRASDFFVREADDDDGDNRPMDKGWQMKTKSGQEIKYPDEFADDQEENIDVEM